MELHFRAVRRMVTQTFGVDEYDVFFTCTFQPQNKIGLEATINKHPHSTLPGLVTQHKKFITVKYASIPGRLQVFNKVAFAHIQSDRAHLKIQTLCRRDQGLVEMTFAIKQLQPVNYPLMPGRVLTL